MKKIKRDWSVETGLNKRAVEDKWDFKIELFGMTANMPTKGASTDRQR